jgi:asparagine synthase (glutamine-hydrolysing)
MCGIVGVINFNHQHIDKNKVIKMNNILSHRGPDFGDVFIDNNIALGHRRLSIIDLSNQSNQPFQYQDPEFYITYNGEVYNYIELREELQNLGYTFKTTSDTEVVLASYIHWGEECFNKFNGMWALAIYNSSTKNILICRDRFGVKPLYYFSNKEKFLFASEKKAIVLSDFVELEFDRVGINTGLKSPFILEASGHTEFKNVMNLLPGSLIKIENSNIEIKKWYNLKDHIDLKIPDTFEKRVEKFKELFQNACSLRLRSDVPIATSLSGGLDSSSVVAVLSQLGSVKHKTFSHSFKGTSLDEMKFAEIVADTTKTPIEEVIINKGEIIDEIDNILYSFESVYAGMPDSAYRIYKAQNKKGYKISIDGHGADEMLGGYGWYLDELQKDFSFLNFTKQKEIKEHKEEIISQKNKIKKQSFLRYLYNKLPENTKLNVKLIFKREKINKSDLYSYEAEELPKSWTYLKKSLYIDFNYTVLPRILKNFDTMSMANSIEVRMPFLDYRLVQYVYALPNSDLINKKWSKYILRCSMDGVLDNRVIWRKDKIGMNSPINELMREELKEWTQTAIDSLNDEDFLNKVELENEFQSKILSSDNWDDSIEFWKKINTIKLMNIYKAKKYA